MPRKVITKLPMVEGHARIIKAPEGKGFRYDVAETARFLQKSCCGQNLQRTHFIVYRICGMCPSSHEEALFKSIENIEKIGLSETAKNLREMKRQFQIVKDSIFHYCHFSTPIFSRETISFSEGKKRKDLHLLGTLYKKINNFAKEGIESIKLSLGSASLHKGDFLSKVDKVIECAKNLLEYYPPPPFLGTHHLESEALMATMKGQTVFLGTNSTEVREMEFTSFIRRVGYTLENYALFEGKPLKTGPMARMHLLYSHSEEFFSPSVRPLIEKIRDKISKIRPLDKLNPFDEHYIRLVEIFDCLEKIKSLAEAIPTEKRASHKADNITGRAYGYVEAPRGILIYRTAIEKGIIKTLNILTPTAFFIPHINDIIGNAKSLDEAIEVVIAGNPCNACFEEQD